ncbi:MAG: phosphodiester glycosidase family protein [Candidatus Marinimicrobia bacterium]|nr:phosphodiester glycosidase family protein [Candidatus Neomarinimicrobiota bacterium]
MKNKLLFGLLFFIEYLFSGETISRIIGPGSNYYNYIDWDIPVSVHIIEIDLTNPNIEIITQKAKSKLIAREKTSVMVQQTETEGNIVIGAVNADFFYKDGKPVGLQIADGEILKNPQERAVFGLLEDKQLFIDILTFQGWLFTDNQVCEINGINSNRGEDDLILFNTYAGVSSNTNNWGYEISAQYLKKPMVNDTSWLVVTSKYEARGDLEIPGYGVVLSGHGMKEKFLRKFVEIGDTVKILLELPPVKNRILEAISGGPKIIDKGRIKIDLRNENFTAGFSTTRHPRTAIGYNKEMTKVLLFVVDGRQNEYSMGMSLRDLAKFMINWGVYEGLNLDGGGSSTMYVRGEIVNKPSDSSGERPVSNALMVLCNRYSDQVKYLNLAPKRLRLKVKSEFIFDVKIFDEYYNPLKEKEIRFISQHPYGYFEPSGKFFSTDQTGSGYVYVECDGVRDSCWVIVE